MSEKKQQNAVFQPKAPLENAVHVENMASPIT